MPPAAPAAPPPPPPIASAPAALSQSQVMAAASAAAGKGKSGTIKTSAQGAPAPDTTNKMLIPSVAGTKSVFGQ